MVTRLDDNAVFVSTGFYHRGVNGENLYGPFATKEDAEARFQAVKAEVDGFNGRIFSRFAQNDTVTHKKSGGVYIVEELPTNCRIEATGEPAYAYRGTDGILWVRSALEFEDGRFELLPKEVTLPDVSE